MGNVRTNVILRRVRATIVAVEKQYVLYIMSECLWHEVASIKFAFPIFSSVACPHLRYFSTVSHNGTIFGGGGGV